MTRCIKIITATLREGAAGPTLERRWASHRAGMVCAALDNMNYMIPLASPPANSNTTVIVNFDVSTDPTRIDILPTARDTQVPTSADQRVNTSGLPSGSR